MKRIKVIDSHTGGEPTRVVVAGGPDLGSGTMAERAAVLRARFDSFRSATVNEPRGNDAIVGALLCEPSDPTCDAGVIFYNNVGNIGMCGHGTIGLVVTLAHMGRVQAGRRLRLETHRGQRGSAAERRTAASPSATCPATAAPRTCRVDAPGIGTVHGDIAWGGNWFFLCERPRPGTCARPRGGADRFRLAHPRGAGGAGITGADGARDRPHRAVRPAHGGRRRQQELRALPRQSLRPLALRHRHQRQARLPVRRWQAAARPGLAAGKHHRQRVRRRHLGGGRQALSGDHRLRLRELPKPTCILDERDPFCYGIPRTWATAST